MWWPQVPLRMLRREVSATQHRLVMVTSYLPQNGPKTQKFDFLAWTPIKNENETSFQISASRLSKWRLRFLRGIFLRLDSILACSVLSACTSKKIWCVKDRKLWAWKIYYIVFSYRLSGRSKTIIWLIKFLQTTDARTRMSSICIVKNQRGQGYSWWKKYL